MAKRGLYLDFLRELRKTRKRFFSIFMLVVIAVSFLFGLRMSAPDMEHSMDAYLDGQRLMDVHILSTLGLTREDVDALSAVEGTLQAEGSYTADALCSDANGQESVVVKVLSMGSGTMNLPYLEEGRLPQKASECLLEQKALDALGLSIGDSVRFNTGTGLYEDVLAATEFTVVGVARNPLYVSRARGNSTLGSGSVDAVAVVPDNSFDMDYFTDIYLICEGAEELNTYSDEYDRLIDEYKQRIETIQPQREQARTEAIRAEAQEKVDDAREEYNTSKADADQELEDGWNELVDAREKLDDGWADYNQGKLDLNDAWQTIADSEEELKDAKDQLNQGESDYSSGKSKYDKGLEEYYEGLSTYRENLDLLNDQQAELDASRQHFIDGLTPEETDALVADQQKELDKGYAALEDAKKDLMENGLSEADAEAAVQEGRTALEAQKQHMVDGLTPEEAEALLADGQAQLDSQQAALNEQKQHLMDGLSPEEAEAFLADGQSELDSQQADLDAQKQHLMDGLSQEEAEGKLADEQKKINADYAALAQQRQELIDGGMTEEEADAALQSQRDALQSQQDALDAQKQHLMDGLSQEEADAALAEPQGALDSQQAALDAQKQHLMDGLTQEEAEALLAEPQAQLDNAQGALDAQKQHMVDGLSPEEADELLKEQYAQLEAAKQHLMDGLTEEEADNALKEQKGKLDEGQTLLDGQKQHLMDGLSPEEADELLKDGQSQLDQAFALLAAGEKELNESGALLDRTGAQLRDARSTLDKGWTDYFAGRDQLTEARTKANDALGELNDALDELNDGEADYADGLKEYEDGKQEADEKLTDAQAKLDDAQKKIDDLDDAEWYVLDRSSNNGFASFEQDADRMSRLSLVFPTVFFLVAALVCLTTMTRMVEEQRVQIGSLKAMGFSKQSISLKYVGYGLLASLLGSGVGLLLGGTGIPLIVVNCWKIMYNYPNVLLRVNWVPALGCLAAAVGSCSAAVLMAALATLRATPAQLMRPRAPQAGRRVWLEYITPVWKRMSFNAKVTARNLFRYQRRFWMTVIGIAGCTGLMITGLGLRDSIIDILSLQFERVSPYSAVLYLDDNATGAEKEQVFEAIAGHSEIVRSSICTMDTVTLESPSYTLDGNLLSAEKPADLDDFWNFYSLPSGEHIELPEEGALIPLKTSELLRLSVGDSITVVKDDQRVQIPVAGIVENYVQHYVYLSDAAYEAAFGSSPERNQILMNYAPGADWEQLGSDLLSEDGVAGIFYTDEVRSVVHDQLNGILPAVMIIIASAAALAFVVLFNLSDINITERKRELATLKVLGFRQREVRDYVFRENFVLTVFGTLLGLVVGKYFHRFLISTVEVELVQFVRSAHVSSYVISVVLTLLFALVVNLVGGRSVRQIDMVESLKTID